MVSPLHIGVLAFPFGTHAAPLLTLVQRLAASAPWIQFSFFNTSASNDKIFNAHVSGSYDNIKVYNVWDGTSEGFFGSHFEAVGLFLKASPGNFEKVIGEAEEETGLEICCFISDAFLWFACDLADRKGVPWVAFWTAASCSLSAHVYTQEIVKAGGLSSTETAEEETTVSFVPGLEMVRFSDLPPEIFLDKNPSPFALTINIMVQKLPQSTAVVLNSFEEIDPVITNDLKSKFQHFLNIGPSILSSPTPTSPDDKTGCLSWLEKQSRPKSVIYISFGSVVTPPENELVALAEALETCKFPFLWSLKDHAKKSLPEGFLNRTIAFGKIVPWAPQLQVLGHKSVGLFVTHCGWNSILESICGSVPMICRPFFGDQKLNGRMVEDSWKIGVRIKGGVFTKNETIEVLNNMMSGEEGKKVRENIYQLKEKAVNAVDFEGSSTKNFKKLLEIIGGPKCDKKLV
ncbi:UDP-glucuronosyl and UDP-glucosyl transferase [Handroanthus impetiginosus]|uniref:Glycosyltransferase n=1 Tax=Handroanthus impetiginosus TaxID=429701 RepID=A0A2G9HSM6_9LAMI|nr:UDP-glucuronosyl and UDP-glucosyl transferase [Handroanthus impetiginosus]